MALGASVYKLVFDTQGLENVTASRRELALSKQIMEETTPEVDKLAASQANLDRLVAKGLIDQEKRNEVLAKITAELPENVAAEEERNQVLKNAAAIIERNVTVEERLNAELATAKKHLNAGSLSAEQYGREEKRVAEALDEHAKAERRKDEALQRGIALNKEFMPASEQARNKLAELRAAYDAGHVSIESYRNGTIQLTATQLTGIPVVGKMASTLASIGPIGAAVAVASAGMAAGIALISKAASYASDKVSEQITKIDDLITASQTLNIPVGKFQELSHAADMADISQQNLTMGTEKLLDSVSKAATGSARMERAFKLMGLNAQELRRLNPDEIFYRVTGAMDNIATAADKVRVSTAIFGSPDFLRMNSSSVEKTRQLFKDLDGLIKPVQEARFNAFDDSVKNMNLSLDVTWKKITMSVVPALQELAEGTTNALISVNKSDEFTAGIDRMENAMRGAAFAARALIEDLPRLGKAWRDNSDIGSMMSPSGFGFGDFEDLGGLLSQVDRIFALQKTEPRRDGMTDTGRVEAISSELDAIEKLTEKLREEAATKGMSAAMAKVWKMEQLGATEAALQVAREYATEADKMEKTQKANDAIQRFTETLRQSGETSQQSARRLAELKLEHAGVTESMRIALMAQFDISESQKKLTEEHKKHADALARVGESIDKQEAKLNGFNSATGKHEDRVRAGERALLAWQLAHEKADAATTKATLGHFDATTALEKRQKATEAAMKAEEELQKRIRQAGMTDEQKQLDDLKEAGVNDEQLKLIANLQKEAALRGLIKQELTATGLAMKANGREAADAFAKANQAAVRASFLRQQAAGGPVSASGEPVGVPLVRPTAEPLRDPRLDADRAAKLRADVQDRIADRGDPFEDNEIRARLMSQANEKRIADMERRDQIMGRAAEDKAAKALADANIREQISNRLNGVTVTPQPAPPTMAGANANQSKEQLQESKAQTKLLGQLVDKPIVIVVEEVTL